MKNMRKGFTLVEVLIVVVIIAILASLIVPRMLMQTEKAKAAEALQMIGAIKRAADRYYDFHGTYITPTYEIYADPAGAASAEGDWADLGLDDSNIRKTKYWAYNYSPGNNILDVQTPDGVKFATYNMQTELWSCDGIFFKELKNAGGNVTGRTI